VVAGASLSNDRSGTVDSAYHFDGVDDGIRVPNSPSLSINNFHAGYTVAAWINPDYTSPSHYNIFSKGKGGFSLRLNRSSLEACHQRTGSTGCQTASINVSTGSWSHVAVTWDAASGDWQMYHNGSPGSYIGNNVDLQAMEDGDVTIGRDSWYDRWHFAGRIDDVRIYNRALTAEEIGQLTQMESDSGDVVVPFTPDPLCPSGDELYEIYRRGFIGRHLASNGRVLQTIGLESVDEASGAPYETPAKDYWVNFAGRILIETSAGHRYTFHPDNIRYSYEESSGAMKSCTTPDSELVPRLWVPMMSPMKEQGMSNSGYYVVSGNGDNPSYYGGMALAMFSLEHRYGVSDHSLEYARKLAEYFHQGPETVLQLRGRI